MPRGRRRGRMDLAAACSSLAAASFRHSGVLRVVLPFLAVMVEFGRHMTSHVLVDWSVRHSRIYKVALVTLCIGTCPKY
jgi:hypothetical protein